MRFWAFSHSRQLLSRHPARHRDRRQGATGPPPAIRAPPLLPARPFTSRLRQLSLRVESGAPTAMRFGR